MIKKEENERKKEEMIENEEEEEESEGYQDLNKPRKKKQKPKSKKVTEVTDEDQKQMIEDIIQDPKIGIISKALNLVQHPFLNSFFVYKYLKLHDKTTLAEFVADPALAKIKKPEAHSASDWSQNELKYYNISIEKQSLNQMFGSEISVLKLDDDEDVHTFLKKHEGSFFQKYLNEIWNNKDRRKDYDYYCSLLCGYKTFPNIEASVNQFMGFLLNLNFGKDFW